MIILSIDVGIKNLAYCIIKLNIINDKINDNTIEILDWNIVNLCETNNLDKKIKTDSLLNIGINLKNHFDNNSVIQNVELILIENQIGPIANKMKTIQGMISQYFICKNNYNIELISAINKLKPFLNEENKQKNKDYQQRKKFGIEIMTNLINNNDNFLMWKDYFLNNKKKDDLSDSFLQCYSYLIQNNKLIN
jgi:hypothetical protein